MTDTRTDAPVDALVLRGVTKRFGPIVVLEGIDLQVRAGERHALIGPNGAGKSTLFHMVSGYLAPTAGDIAINGTRVNGFQPHRLNRGGLSRSFQITAIFDRLSVRDNVYMAVMSRHGKRWSLWRQGPLWRQIDRETDEILQGANLAHQAGRDAGTLSYSEQRTLEICMTVATGPEVILLDEPTAGMSREETQHIVAFIRRLTQGRTLVMVEHDMDVVFGLADRISVLCNGRILATGTPDAIRGDARVQEAYLGALEP